MGQKFDKITAEVEQLPDISRALVITSVKLLPFRSAGTSLFVVAGEYLGRKWSVCARIRAFQQFLKLPSGPSYSHLRSLALNRAINYGHYLVSPDWREIIWGPPENPSPAKLGV